MNKVFRQGDKNNKKIKTIIMKLKVILNKNLTVNLRFLIDFNIEETLKETVKTLRRCAKHLSIKSNLYIAIKPTNDLFVKEKLHGVAGYTPSKDHIVLSLYSGSKNWKKIFSTTLVHEYSHALAFHFYPLPKTKKFTLLHGIISEGIADNFTEDVMGKIAPWIIKSSLQKHKRYFPKIKTILDNKNSDVYNEIFLGKGKYPLWIGYLLGYQIVKSFLNKNPKKEWKQIIKLSPYKILKESSFNL